MIKNKYLQLLWGSVSRIIRWQTPDLVNGFPAVCSAVWDGKDIIATTGIESVGLKFTDRMSLSADGKTLTSKVQIASAQGNGDVTIVFDRQKRPLL